ncbi:hypothetical protein E2562_000569 [Oryza meyeriana var. granulata]|uniref:Uncharacterized protein n=1 Tax=Oryza meyeriana var. granulata TaxID=110450 RepID=A0A6G1DU32_9ORYZ|nr:hypothetical protein E2562_000569 [Oryza meyeriana var. granulata]
MIELIAIVLTELPSPSLISLIPVFSLRPPPSSPLGRYHRHLLPRAAAAAVFSHKSHQLDPPALELVVALDLQVAGSGDGELLLGVDVEEAAGSGGKATKERGEREATAVAIAANGLMGLATIVP